MPLLKQSNRRGKPMELAKAMNTLLFNSCRNPVAGEPWDSDWESYTISLCCVTYEVIAKHLGNQEYEIRSMERVKD